MELQRTPWARIQKHTRPKAELLTLHFRLGLPRWSKISALSLPTQQAGDLLREVMKNEVDVLSVHI